MPRFHMFSSKFSKEHGKTTSKGARFSRLIFCLRISIPLFWHFCNVLRYTIGRCLRKIRLRRAVSRSLEFWER